ncbi:hydroxysteroid 11-beta-dehydrogenase 1-like protein isoform X5 [Gallus gallus]|uniref:hydroxysteroid 11-beta-dehydrogenase 1-like protein isoform X5 n=1 Tax=Gallus gallus TaxID=9031 RepID=UPI001AE95C23|nr:hydroxysteroid 11-beta-dehydrogenase 1-like protein isoform X5 [Gallus gallus]
MMKPFGKVLCAAGSLAVLLAFFWRDTFQPEQLSGARVLLTGASAGIGEQMAYHYATFGAEIVLTARREAVLQEVMKKCLTLGAKKVFYIPADMSSPSEPDRVVQFAVQNLGGLDYLVLNHIGVSPFQMWGGDVEHTRWLMQGRYPPPSPPPTQPRSSHWTASSAPCATSSRCRRGTSPSRCASSASSTPTRRWRRPEAKCSSPPLRRQKRLSPSSAAVPRGCGSSSTRGGCSPCTACGCCSPTPACCRASTTTAARDGAPRGFFRPAGAGGAAMEETAEASKGGGPHRTAPRGIRWGSPPPPTPPTPPPFCSCWSFFVLFFVPFQRR